MYSGGYAAYFTKLLVGPRFLGQHGISYFAMEKANWMVVAFDTAYHAIRGTTYLDGALE